MISLLTVHEKIDTSDTQDIYRGLHGSDSIHNVIYGDFCLIICFQTLANTDNSFSWQKQGKLTFSNAYTTKGRSRLASEALAILNEANATSFVIFTVLYR